MPICAWPRRVLKRSFQWQKEPQSHQSIPVRKPLRGHAQNGHIVPPKAAGGLRPDDGEDRGEPGVGHGDFEKDLSIF